MVVRYPGALRGTSYTTFLDTNLGPLVLGAECLDFRDGLPIADETPVGAQADSRAARWRTSP